MKVVGLDGKTYTWSLESAKRTDDNKSNLHVRARDIIREFFPYDRIYEDVTLPGTGKSPLYADFYIPNKSLIIEVNGIQHFQYTSFFHKSKLDFFKAQARDRKKEEWCELNDITIVQLNYDETDNDWRAALNGR